MRSSLIALLLVLAAPVNAAITFQGTAATGVDTASTGTYQAWDITPGGSGAANGDLCVLDASLDGQGGSTWPTISAAGGQTWNTLFQNETSTYSRARYWTTFNGTWTGGKITITSTNTNGAFAITGLLTCFHPTSSSYTWSVDVATSQSEFSLPGGSCDVTIAGQTPTASASVVTLGAWMDHGNDTWAVQTGGWTNPNSVTQVRNSYAGAHLSVSQAYKIQSSASATGNVTNRESTCNPGWTAITTFKETMGGGGGGTGFTNRFIGFFGGAFARNLGGSGGSPPPSTAIKFQPGWYGGYDTTCSAGDTARCSATPIVAIINSEICPNSNLVGMQMTVEPAFLIPDSAATGDYTGNSTQGFTVIDAVLAALQACSGGPKYLILEATYGPIGGFGAPNAYVPSFTYPAVGCGLYTCAGGTAVGVEYGVVPNSQASQPGFTAQMWKDEWRELAIAAVRAYCGRYDTNSSFYGIGVIYYNTSIPFTYPYTNGYSEAQMHNQIYAYQTAARSACPHTNIPLVEDYVDSYPARMTSDIQSLQTMHGTFTNNDIIPQFATHGQAVLSGMDGGTDYRGVVRDIEVFEGPCYGVATPAVLFDILQNGNANQRPRWPNTIVIWMSDGCDATQDWSAWKTFIASGPISGKVMNGRDSTLRTPAAVKSGWCETSMMCP